MATIDYKAMSEAYAKTKTVLATCTACSRVYIESAAILALCNMCATCCIAEHNFKCMEVGNDTEPI